jgi:hypothetical protein
MVRKRILLGFISIILLLILTSSSSLLGNDFVLVDLRTDIPEVMNSLDYHVWIASAGGPSSNYPTFTTAWLSVDLDNLPGLYGHLLSQVGLMADSRGIYWFVYAEPGVECLQGYEDWWSSEKNMYLGCKGYIGQFVGFGHFHRVELLSYRNGYWIARVEDSQGVPHEVARILSNVETIFDASVDMEEG